MKTGTEMLHIIYVMRMTGWCENFTSDCCNISNGRKKKKKDKQNHRQKLDPFKVCGNPPSM